MLVSLPKGSLSHNLFSWLWKYGLYQNHEADHEMSVFLQCCFYLRCHQFTGLDGASSQSGFDWSVTKHMKNTRVRQYLQSRTISSTYFHNLATTHHCWCHNLNSHRINKKTAYNCHTKQHTSKCIVKTPGLS